MAFLKSDLQEMGVEIREGTKSMDTPIKKLASIGSSLATDLASHFNVREDEITLEKIQEFYEIERNKVAQNGLPFTTPKELMDGVKQLEKKWNIKIIR